MSFVQAWNKLGGVSYKAIKHLCHIFVEGLPATPTPMVATIQIHYSEPMSSVPITYLGNIVEMPC